MTGEEVDKLFRRASPNFRAMILLGVNCGLGPADVGRLRWSHLNLASRTLDMPRAKTGVERRGFLWKRTVKTLRRVKTLKHARRLARKEGSTALVFVTRTGLPYYREGKKGQGESSNAICITFGRMAKELGLEGVTFYRLRHSLKTLGKKARDPDAIALMMGHKERSIGRVYDHEYIGTKRLRKVTTRVHRLLWPSSRRNSPPRRRS